MNTQNVIGKYFLEPGTGDVWECIAFIGMMDDAVEMGDGTRSWAFDNDDVRDWLECDTQGLTIAPGISYLRTFGELLGMSSGVTSWVDEVKDIDFDAFEAALTPKCDCGAVKAKTTHSSWCSTMGAKR